MLPSPGDLPNPGIEPRSSALQADSLPAEPPGKPKNTRVGSVSLLQPIFLTEDLNQGLLHCRRSLYQLSYQGSPNRVGGSLFSTPSPAFIVCRFFNDGHSDWCEAIPHYSLDLDFSNNE